MRDRLGRTADAVQVSLVKCRAENSFKFQGIPTKVSCLWNGNWAEPQQRMCRLMALAEPRTGDMQHIRDITALTSPGQAWTVPVELGRAQKQPPQTAAGAYARNTWFLCSTPCTSPLECSAEPGARPVPGGHSARAAACTVEVGAPLPKWGETKSCSTGGLFTSTAPPAAGRACHLA